MLPTRRPAGDDGPGARADGAAIAGGRWDGRELGVLVRVAPAEQGPNPHATLRAPARRSVEEEVRESSGCVSGTAIGA